jgi:hypothetical protein
MQSIGIAFDRRPGAPLWMHLTGDMRPGWCARLSAGLAERGVDILGAHATALAVGSWDARFELHCPRRAALERGDVCRMLETEPAEAACARLDLVGFALEPSTARGGCLRLDLAGRDRIGFLATLLCRIGTLALRPVELSLHSSDGRARNRLWLRGAGGRPPSAASHAALQASLDALVQARSTTRVRPGLQPALT